MILTATAGCAGVSDSGGASTKAETADAKLQALANQATQTLVDPDRWHGDGIIAGRRALGARAGHALLWASSASILP